MCRQCARLFRRVCSPGKAGIVAEAAFWGFLSAVSLVAGSIVALRWAIPTRIVGLVMAIGAGALISAVAYELVDEAIEVAGGSGWPLLGIAAGALAFFVGDYLVDRKGGDNRKDISGDEDGSGNGKAIALGSLLDGVPESIVIGASLVAGGGVSVAMVAAAMISNFPEGLGGSASLLRSGESRRRVLGVWTAIVVISAISAAVGYAVLDDAPKEAGAFFQMFAAGAMLTMLTDSMIPESHEEGGNAAGLFTVIGFLLAIWIATFE
jgi:ZIP family zinc transporter